MEGRSENVMAGPSKGGAYVVRDPKDGDRGELVDTMLVLGGSTAPVPGTTAIRFPPPLSMENVVGLVLA